MHHRTPRSIRAAHSALLGPGAAMETLEPRRLLATAFNPDGPTVSTPADAPTSIITADFDGDAKPDLVTSVGNDIIFQKGTGGGRFGPPRVLMHLNASAGLLGVGDFNQDGVNDLISVEKQTYRGWYRMLLNNGQANFFVASYGRTETLVESVTVGNIDSDSQDEVLLEGRSVLITLGQSIGEPLDEIRVLDPNRLVPIITTDTPAAFNLLPFLRFNDLGRVIVGPRFATPVIAHLLDGAANQIVVGSKESGGADGFVQIYSFVAPSPLNPGPLGLPGPLFNPLTPGFTTTGAVSSVGVADMNGDSKPDLVVATLAGSVIPSPLTFESGFFTGRTLVLPRTGATSELTFGGPETLEQRTIAAPAASERRIFIPEYRIATLSDINSDGRIDVGMSLVQEFSGDAGFRRVARFVQIFRDDNAIYSSLIVAQLTVRTAPGDFTVDRTPIFHAADIRRIGRPDLFIATPHNASGFTPITIRYNVQAPMIIAF